MMRVTLICAVLTYLLVVASPIAWGIPAPEKKNPKKKAATPQATPAKTNARSKTTPPAGNLPAKTPLDPATAKGHEIRLGPAYVRLGGYLQTGFRFTFNDPKLLRLGESDGFYVRRARLKFAAGVWGFGAVLSLDGAYDFRADPMDVSPGDRKVYAALRDAYLHYSHKSGFFVHAGQRKVPFGQLSERSSADEAFIQSPLLDGGEDSAFGYPTPGLGHGRDIGLALGFARSFSPLFGISVQAMLFNGNGSNRFGNDSDLPAASGRLRFDIGSFLKIGGSILWNPRRTGEPPSLFEETDIVAGGDLGLYLAGIHLEGEFLWKSTTFPTTGEEEDQGYGFRVDLGYTIKIIGLQPVVRFEWYDPSSKFDDDRLMYVTFGLNWFYKVWRHHQLQIRLNYILKLEEKESRTLNNDQVNLLFQYRF